MKYYFIPLFTLLLFDQGLAQDTLADDKACYFPDYAKVQFAGNIGFVSAGFGYLFFNNNLCSELIYGYVPKTISKSKPIHTISVKNTFSILNQKFNTVILSPVAGFAASLETGSKSFINLPDKYPKGYYKTNAFHFTFFIGAKMHKDFINSPFIKGIDLYFESGTVDYYLWHLILSREIKINQIVSSSIGINLFF